MHAYSDASPQVRREAFPGEAGGAATTEYSKFRSFQQIKLKNVHAIVTTAGTNAAHGFDVFHGTTSIGSIVLGVGAAGTLASLVPAATGGLNRIIASAEQVSVKSKADIVGKAHIIFEYHTQHDSDQTR